MTVLFEQLLVSLTQAIEADQEIYISISSQPATKAGVQGLTNSESLTVSIYKNIL